MRVIDRLTSAASAVKPGSTGSVARTMWCARRVRAAPQ